MQLGLNSSKLGENEEAKNNDAFFKELDNVQEKLRAAIENNGMPQRDKIVNRDRNACMQFVRYIYYRMAFEVIKNNMQRINDGNIYTYAGNIVTRRDLQLILEMEIDNPDYETMESFLEKLYDINQREIFECNVLYEEKSFWSLRDLVGTLKNYINPNSVLKKSTGDIDYVISIYDSINK